MRVPTAASQETCSCRGSGMSLSVPRDGPYSLPVPGRASERVLRDVGTPDRCEAPELRGRCYKTFRLLTGPCQALGADTPRDAELRSDLACRRLGSERKYVKRIYARDTRDIGRQFAR
jgi:hypothetical protein